MTLLLKSVWRTVLRGGQLNNALRSTSFSSVSVTDTRSKTPDNILMTIKTAPSTREVLAAVQANLPLLTHRHMLQALRSLFELQKTSKYDKDRDTDAIIKDPTFSVLCQNFKKHARALDVNEIVEAVKVLSYLKVPVDSLIVQTMLQLIRCNINTLNTQQIMFLDFLLSQFGAKNHLVDALKLALPLAFQIHLPLELDDQDLPLLRDMLLYCCSHDLPDRCINNVVTGLLLHDQALNAQMAKSIIWALCQVNCTEQVFPTRVQLLHICCDILTHSVDSLPYDDVLRTAARLKGRILEKHPEYYHQQLMDAIANYVINNNVEFEKGLLVARVLSRIAHTHLSLIEYLCHKAAAQPDTLSNARTNIFFGFINCLANNNFTPEPDQWEELRRQISANPLLNATNAALPWAKLCLELASLGCYEVRLLNRVFSKEFLDEYLARDNNTLDYLQLLTLYEAVQTFYSEDYKLPEEVLRKAKEMYPVHSLTGALVEHLTRGLGGPEYVAKNVALPNGIVSDVLVAVEGGCPIELPALSSSSKVPIEQLNIPQGAIIICVMNFNQGCFSMNSNRLRGPFRLILDILERQGYATVAFNVSEWLNSPEHERTPYLMREIGYKCGEIGLKLSAT
ncbi:uncharacterized protein LOC120632243 isoform X1 [Pararge aegeria]|nr:uncharacterized protein LOC120632243 isoform X1 [Pararge aegeria]XP_039757985.1 uncharacterized protein LOC120632243 isoform X1 [Pararge aegeria]XP_039757986.1 uncharacterized protein LOC120632243 isoform X1 [Pararge aegeria]XP_039757987.1 uncharacterized protein LOC120632243 isoform X1 [Pararge aegeria]